MSLVDVVVTVFDGHDSHECGAMICSSFSPDAKRAQLYVPLSGKNQFKYVWLEPAMDTAQPSFAATAQFWRMHMASSASSASSAETLSSTDTNMAMALPLAVREFPSGLLFYADKAKGTTFFVEAPTLAVSMGLPPSQPSTVHLLLWIGVEQSELIDDCIDYSTLSHSVQLFSFFFGSRPFVCACVFRHFGGGSQQLLRHALQRPVSPSRLGALHRAEDGSSSMVFSR